MSQSMRDALQDGIALLGTALASIGSAGYLPDSITMIGAGGGGLALIAMLEKAWRNNKDEIIDEIEDGIDDPILYICCEHILQEMEEASDGSAHEDDLMEICASVGFDESEVREAIEHLVVANQISHLGDGLYGFAD